MKRILILHEKMERYIALEEDAGYVDTVLLAVLKERLESHAWYVERGEESAAKQALQSGRVRRFMDSRRRCEYEGWEIRSLEALTPGGQLE